MDNLNKKEFEALKYIRNSLIHNGRKPTYQRLMDLLNYKSPRSVNLIMRSLIEKGYLAKDEFGALQVLKYPEIIETKTIKVPLVGHISCGHLQFAEEHIEKYLTVSTMLAKPPYKYFILRANGHSMNKTGIEDNDLVLIRKQPTARNGEIVAALVDDTCTLKTFYKNENFIILKPNSTSKEYTPILLTNDFTILGVMVMVIPEI